MIQSTYLLPVAPIRNQSAHPPYKEPRDPPGPWVPRGLEQLSSSWSILVSALIMILWTKDKDWTLGSDYHRHVPVLCLCAAAPHCLDCPCLFHAFCLLPLPGPYPILCLCLPFFPMPYLASFTVPCLVCCCVLYFVHTFCLLVPALPSHSLPSMPFHAIPAFVGAFSFLCLPCLPVLILFCYRQTCLHAGSVACPAYFPLHACMVLLCLLPFPLPFLPFLCLFFCACLLPLTTFLTPAPPYLHCLALLVLTACDAA